MLVFLFSIDYVKVFSHDIKGGVFSSKADVASKNPNNPHADLLRDIEAKMEPSDSNFAILR